MSLGKESYNASWLQVVFSFFPLVVIALSTLIPVKSSRMDDVIAMLMIALILFVFIIHSLFVMKCRSRNYRRVLNFLMIVFPLVGWIYSRGDFVTGLEFGVVFFLFFSMLIISCLRGRESIFGIREMLKASICSYLVFVLIVMVVTGIDNDRFLEITSVNINSVILPILPAVAWWVHLVNASWRKFDLFIFSVFLLDVLLTGSKQTILTAMLVVIISMGLQVQYKRWLLFAVVLASFFILLPENSWLFSRFEQINLLFKGDWNQVSSVTNRLVLWVIYFDAYLQHWVAGFGMGNTHAAFLGHLSDVNSSSQFMENIHTPHNSFLRFMVEGGVVLLIGILLLHVLVVMTVFREYKRRHALRLLIVLLTAIFMGAFFTEVCYTWSYWVALAQIVVFSITPLRTYSKKKGDTRVHEFSLE